MNSGILDLSYLYEVSGDDPAYVYDILCLFLENVPLQLGKLEQYIRSEAEWSVIQKQAHALKSSVLFVKIKGLYDGFYSLEMAAKQNTGRDMMVSKIDEILAIFAEALPLLHAEQEKCLQASKK